jgi:RHS repeat-associated protein
VLLCLTISPARAQQYSENAIGLPAFSEILPVEKGFINVPNGNLHLEIPLGSFPQRGEKKTNVYLAYDSSIWYAASAYWTPVKSYDSDNVSRLFSTFNGWRFVNSHDPGQIQHTYVTRQVCSKDGMDSLDSVVQWTWTDPEGSVHAFNVSTTKGSNNACGNHLSTSGDSVAIDGSGYHLYVTNGDQAKVYAADGTFMTEGDLGNSHKDANGNYIGHHCVSGCSTIDTLGRIPVTKTVNGNQIYYDVLNSQESTSRYTVTTEPISVSTNFGQSYRIEYSGTLTVIQSIQLPDGTRYSFGYDSGTTPGHYGQLTSMTLPTGGTITYSYSYTTGNNGRYAASKTNSDGTWNIGLPQPIPGSCSTNPPYLNCQYQVTVTKPNNDNVVYTFTSNGGLWPTQIQYYNGAVLPGNLLATLIRSWDFSHPCPSTQVNRVYIVLCTDMRVAAGYPSSAIYVTKTAETVTLPLPGGGSVTKTSQFTWEPSFNGNLTQLQEWNFYTGSLPATPDRTTNFTYLNSFSYLNANIVDRPVTQTTLDKNGNIVEQTINSYDGSALVAVLGVTQHDDTNYGTGNAVRGNLTQVQHLVSGTSNFITTSKTYDTTGQVVTSTDGNGNVTTYGYADNFFNDAGDTSNPVPYTPPAPTNAYLKSSTSGTMTSTLGHYWGTGQLALSTDSNNQSAYHHYFDSLSRYTSTKLPDGGWTFLQYNSTGTQTDTGTGISGATLTTNCPVTSNACRHDQTLFDGLERLTSRVLVSDPDGATTLTTAYDSNGRPATASNPYRSTSDSTYGWTTKSYDGLDRTIQVQRQDGSLFKTYYGPQVSSGGATAQLCSSNTYGFGYPVLTVDEAGKKRQIWIDGFNRTIEADEPDSTSTLSVPTCYSYDLNNNLTAVLQNGSRQRTFAYDFVSRLVSSTNPESGTSTHTYDPNGNLLTKTSPAPNQTGTATVTISYCYDALNRPTAKTYTFSPNSPPACTNGTLPSPVATYGYDGVAPPGCTLPVLTIHNGIGKRTGMCDPAGAEAWSYDITPGTGRKTTDARTINGVTKTSIYQNNLAGSIAILTNSSGTTITYTPSATGKISSAVDTANTINYATNARYAPQGALATVQNGGSLYSTYIYNNRLQPCWLYSTTSSTGAPTSCTQTGVANAAILDYQYNFSLGVADNGNPAQVANRRDPTRTQNFVYDGLNRLTSAQTQTTGVTIPNPNCWGLTFGYDAWGNLLSSSTTGPAGCGEPIPLNVTVNASNRIAYNNIANQITNYCYDSAGNLIYITAPAASPGNPCPTSGSYQYTYDAENHLISTASVTYTYDGDGKRVEKSNGKLYWYGTGSTPLDETDAAGNTNNSSFNEYIFFNGSRTARRDHSSNVDYYFSDHLGTARIITNAGGTVLDDSDFYPFGDERPILSSSGNAYKFTGKERDSESGLDNFGARYDSSSLGRFISPDAGPFDLSNPQSLNRYTYALNNPLRFIDPSGNEVVDIGTYVLTTFSQRSEQIDPTAWFWAVVAGSARGSGFQLNSRKDETININQPENGFRVVGPAHPAHGFMEGAWFSDYSTSWTISVDFRVDPGVGMTASIEFWRNRNGVISNSASNNSFRTEDMPASEISLFNFFNLRGLSQEKLDALQLEALRQWGKSGDVRYLEVLVAADAEQKRRLDEERKKREEEERKRKIKCFADGAGDCE